MRYGWRGAEDVTIGVDWGREMYVQYLSLKEYFVTQEMEKHIDSISFVCLYSNLLQVAAACLRVASTERYWERSRLVGKDAAEGNGMLHQRNERVVAERGVGQC